MSEALKNEQSHEIKLTNRKSFCTDGVLYVEHFEETSLTLTTVMGQMTVEGRNLKIEGFSKEEGKVYICGEIAGIYYSEEMRPKKKFFERFFQ